MKGNLIELHALLDTDFVWISFVNPDKINRIEKRSRYETMVELDNGSVVWVRETPREIIEKIKSIRD